jgi:hypothetical protein
LILVNVQGNFVKNIFDFYLERKMKLFYPSIIFCMATAMMPAHADIISDSEQIMDDAQKVYPNLFPFKQETQILEPYRYRFYPR